MSPLSTTLVLCPNVSTLKKKKKSWLVDAKTHCLFIFLKIPQKPRHLIFTVTHLFNCFTGNRMTLDYWGCQSLDFALITD